MKHKILLVDAERRSVRVLGAALRSAGYGVRVASSGVQALDKVEEGVPDVIVSDSQLPKLDGYGLVERLKAQRETAHVPILLLTSRGPSEDRERGRKLGVADYLPKPVFVRELVACIGLLIARSARAKIAASAGTSKSGRFSGSTRDVSVVDLLQTFELLRETGVARLIRGSEGAEIYFRDGRAVDAKLGRLRGEPAIYAALLWNEAALDVEFKPVNREDIIDRSVGTLLVEGMRRVDAWGQIYAQLKPLTTVVEVDHMRLLEQVVSRMSDGKALSADRNMALLQGLGTGSAPLSSHIDANSDDEDDGEGENEEEDHDEDAHGEHDDEERDESDEGAGDDRHHHATESIPVAASAPASAPQRTTEPPPTAFSAHRTEPAPRHAAPAPRHSQPAPAREELSPLPSAPIAQAPAPVAVAAPAHAIEVRDAARRPAAPVADHDLDMEEEDEEPVPMVRERIDTLWLREPSVIVRQETGPTPPVAAVAAAASASSPSSPPWTREVDLPEEEALDHDMPIPGVRRPASRMGKVIVMTSVAVAALICVVAGLRAVNTAHERRAEEGRRTEMVAALAAPAHIDAVPLLPPAAANVEPAAPPLVDPPAAGAAGEVQALQAGVQGPAPVGAGLASGPSPTDTGPRPGVRSPLIAAAEEALVQGATDRALVLAAQAVAATPADADAWLTLAAAHKASGDDSGARADYRSCVAHAHTEGVNHCRVLAAH